MKATELMVGDWVYDNLEYTRKVNAIWDNIVVLAEYKLNKNTAVAQSRHYISDIKPIPLTSEILEKNGFVKVNTQRYDWGKPNGFYVNINPKKKIIHINGANGSNCNMYYIIVGFNVHELQRALRLCGLNELADDFKV